MRKILIYTVIIIVFTIVSCKSTFTEENRQELIAIQEDLMVDSFQFKANTALPFQTQALNNVANDLLLQTGNSTARINLQGNNYSVKIVEQEAQFNLPFYGERRLSGGYNADNAGYEFTGPLKSKSSKIDDKNGYLNYSFSTSNTIETIDVELHIYNVNNVRMSINSSHRTFMEYEGKIVFIEEVKE